MYTIAAQLPKRWTDIAMCIYREISCFRVYVSERTWKLVNKLYLYNARVTFDKGYLIMAMGDILLNLI